MPHTPTHDFSIRLNFSPESERPERVFQSMTSLTLAMKHLDTLLANSINAHIDSHILLSEIQGGSIISKFKSILRKVDDEDLRNLNIKRILGKFLVDAKHKILSETNQLQKIKTDKDISNIISLVENLKKEFEIYNSLNSRPISHKNLLKILQEISNSLSVLELDDTVTIESKEKKTPFNRNFILTDEDIESILTAKSETKRTTLQLKVKKPDYLGKSKWVCKSRYGQMEIKIMDNPWLKDFQNTKEVLLPGDSIRAIIETSVQYDHQGNELNITHYLIEVLEIIRGHPEIQMQLPY